jgi:hypothetical protein
MQWLSMNAQNIHQVIYFIMAIEVCPTTGKTHGQGYIRFRHAVSMTAVKERLNSKQIHLEQKRGTEYEAASYCWKDAEPFIEIGERPTEDSSEKDSSVWDVILRMLQDGATARDIMMEYPAAYARYKSGIEAMRMELIAGSINTWREVNVQYLWGATGVGKTRAILDSMEDPADAYRVTDYKNPFDNYRGQQLIIFEEFRSSIQIEKMLIYLDGYIHELPCRYANKVSAWTDVVIITNIPPIQQFVNVQQNHPETFAAWERRIDTVMELT